MNVTILLFDGLTALDAVGPYEVLWRVPGAELEFVAADPGIKRTDNGGLVGLLAPIALADVTATDVLVIPGGFGTRALMHDAALLEWIRAVHATTTWTASVCTGSLLLGAAGLLDGLPATTHWAAMDKLASTGAVPTASRVVEAGKILTAAGVSAGIDLALTLASRLAGDDVAQAIQLSIEYDPQPPFDSGSIEKAPARIRALVERKEASQSDPFNKVSEVAASATPQG
ncbi:MAG TPA: DJ-1/PfpI family protein [Acidimicrobiales bacterium]|nr:DJ-1/PfpI family protein [Acidimicrobiales bacterium]